jgi:hypothetical protein
VSDVRLPSLPAGDERWKEDAVCRKVVRSYVRAGWTFERAQHYVTSLYYRPGDGLKGGRKPPIEPPPEADPFFLPRLWCSTCPVQAECIDEAVTIRDEFGFRAGFTPNQVKRVIKIRKREKLHEELGVQRLIVSSGKR